MKKLLLILTSVLLVVASIAPLSANAQEDLQTVLIMGVDPAVEVEGSNGEIEGSVEVVALATIDETNQAVNAVNFSQDTVITESETVSDVYGQEGAEGVVAAMNEWLDASIEDYLLVDLEGVEEVVDALGTINVTPPTTFELDGYTFNEGETVALDGPAAVVYRRHLEDGQDDTYQIRQEQVLEGIVEAAADEDIMSKLPDLLGSVTDYIETNLGIFALIGLGNTLNESVHNISANRIETPELTDADYQLIYDSVHFNN
ncbi:LCP family protein [Aerococcaceae bacterium DSM 111176]|nr:LCP family protein [Aerococcaceae bacterium DSM 111176]